MPRKSWRQVSTKADIEEFTELLINSHPAYATETVESITENVFNREDAELWIFDGDTFKIPFSIGIISGQARTFSGIPSGVFSEESHQPQTSKEVIRKIRDYMDRKNVTRLVMNTLDDYGVSAVNDYCLNKPGELMHEYSQEKDKAGLYKRQEFYRDPAKKTDDEKFQGNKKRERI